MDHFLKRKEARGHRAWMAMTVIVVEVIAGRMVEIDRDLDQAQTHQARAEKDVLLGLPGNSQSLRPPC